MLKTINLGCGVMGYGETLEDMMQAFDIMNDIAEQCTVYNKKQKETQYPEIDEVFFNKVKGVTVVLWKDGTKTKVKIQDGDVWDSEKAIALCFMKKCLGNKISLDYIFDKYCIDNVEQ